MENLTRLAAAVAIGAGATLRFGGDGPASYNPNTPPRDHLPQQPKPLTKRQKRRLRGKAKASNRIAQVTETGTAETARLGPQDEGTVRQDAPQGGDQQ